jgi:hypothetical protein
MTYRIPAAVVFVLVLGAGAAAAEAADPTATDRFLAGYASAVLERELGLHGVDVRVAGGRLVLDPAQLEGTDEDTVVEALESIDGLTVEVAEPRERAEPPPTLEESQRLTAATGPLPTDPLFQPLIADPRWPRFSASLQFYDDDSELGTVGSANFGGTLPVYGWQAGESAWQVGLQAGVFSIFDFESDTTALINADYFVGLPLTWRWDALSAQLRLYHQSSHLGDEFLLRSRVDRINLSYEVIDALLSIELFDALRLYGGGGAIVRSEPDLDPWLLQGGFELTSQRPWLDEVLFPILAFDLAADAEQDFAPDYSLRAGFDIRAGFLDERRLMLLFEYFNGQSPNGQFFEQELEYIGTGLHFFF